MGDILRERVLEKSYKELLKYRWIVFACIASVYFFVYFYRVAPAAMSQGLLQEWHLQGSALGTMSSLYFLLYAAVQIPAGIAADTIGPKKSIILSAVVMAIGSVLSYIAPTFTVLSIGRAVIGLGAGLTLVPLYKILRYWFKEREIATMIGFSGAIGSLGSVLASAPLVAAILLVGWRNTFLYVAIIVLGLAALNIKFVEDSPEKKGFPSIEQHQADSTEKLSTRTMILQGVSMWFKNPIFPILAVIMMICYGSLMGLQGLWAGPFLSDVYGMSNSMVGDWLLIMSIGMMLGQVAGVVISDKLFKAKRRLSILVGCTLMVLIWTLLVIVPKSGQHLGILKFLFFALPVADSIATVPIQALVAESSPKETYGTVFGISNMFPFLGGSIFQRVMGTILDKSGTVVENGTKIFPLSGYVATFVFCTLALFIATLLTLFIKERSSAIVAFP